MQKRKIKIKGHATGIDQIDQSWSGLKDGDLYCFCCTSHVDKHNLLAKVILKKKNLIKRIGYGLKGYWAII